MERRTQKRLKPKPPTVFLKRPGFKGKSVEEVKAELRLLAEIQKAVGNGQA